MRSAAALLAAILLAGHPQLVYQAAVLAWLARFVFSIERIASLSRTMVEMQQNSCGDFCTMRLKSRPRRAARAVPSAGSR